MTTKKQNREKREEQRFLDSMIDKFNHRKGRRILISHSGKNSLTTLKDQERFNSQGRNAGKNQTSFFKENGKLVFIKPQKFLQSYKQRSNFHLMTEVLYQDKNPFNHIRIKDDKVIRVPFNPEIKKKVSGSRNIRLGIIQEIPLTK